MLLLLVVGYGLLDERLHHLVGVGVELGRHAEVRHRTGAGAIDERRATGEGRIATGSGGRSSRQLELLLLLLVELLHVGGEVRVDVEVIVRVERLLLLLLLSLLAHHRVDELRRERRGERGGRARLAVDVQRQVLHVEHVGGRGRIDLLLLLLLLLLLRRLRVQIDVGYVIADEGSVGAHVAEQRRLAAHVHHGAQVARHAILQSAAAHSFSSIFAVEEVVNQR